MIILDRVKSATVRPSAPYNFDRTVRAPSHFPTPLEEFATGLVWFTTRYDNSLQGLKLRNMGDTNNPKVGITIYSNKRLSDEHENLLLNELAFRFGFNEDLSEFYSKFRDDNILGPVIERMWGTRKTRDPLYELIMVSILLQNATIKRTVQMMNSLLERYGSLVSFDGKKLYVLWGPEELAKAKEEELRALKVGYRAKMLRSVSKDFADGKVDEKALRTVGKESAKKRLMELYGIGPASADILLFESLGYNDARDHIPPWECKIFSMLFFKKPGATPSRILSELEGRFGEWKALAFYYLIEDLFWRHKQEKIGWLEKLIRL